MGSQRSPTGQFPLKPSRGSLSPWKMAASSSLLLHAISIGTAAILAAMWVAPVEPLTSRPLEIEGVFHESTAVDQSFRIRGNPEESIDPLTPGMDDPRWENAIADQRPAIDRDPAGKSAESTFIQRQIDRSIESGKQRSAQENLDRLSRLSQQLSQKSQSESVDQMAHFLGSVTKRRAERPVENTSGKSIDVSTAQLHDVVRSIDGDGRKNYRLILIDADGITVDVDIDPETGEQLYRTMRLIKANPLLEAVYRKIVMGIMDSVLPKLESDSTEK